ncbi:MAG: hypothetical protein ACK5S6_04025 [bacterium]|jgi:hypothetical protein
MKTAFQLVEEHGLTLHGDIEHFAELVRADERNATLDEIAKKIEAMPFGDTAASFAVWIREQKT